MAVPACSSSSRAALPDAARVSASWVPSSGWRGGKTACHEWRPAIVALLSRIERMCLPQQIEHAGTALRRQPPAPVGMHLDQAGDARPCQRVQRGRRIVSAYRGVLIHGRPPARGGRSEEYRHQRRCEPVDADRAARLQALRSRRRRHVRLGSTAAAKYVVGGCYGWSLPMGDIVGPSLRPSQPCGQPSASLFHYMADSAKNPCRHQRRGLAWAPSTRLSCHRSASRP
jgi:hypothetical protein